MHGDITRTDSTRTSLPESWMAAYEIKSHTHTHTCSKKFLLAIIYILLSRSFCVSSYILFCCEMSERTFVRSFCISYVNWFVRDGGCVHKICNAMLRFIFLLSVGISCNLHFRLFRFQVSVIETFLDGLLRIVLYSLDNFVVFFFSSYCECPHHHQYLLECKSNEKKKDGNGIKSIDLLVCIYEILQTLCALINSDQNHLHYTKHIDLYVEMV